MNKIVKAISKIMGEVGSVKKDGENKFHNYKYATAADISFKLQPLLAREGLVIFQTEKSREMIAGGVALAITYEFLLAHVDGDIWPEKTTHTGMAAALNSKGGFDDKAGNKCHTAARKYFMLALFQIPTGDYEDADEDDDAEATNATGQKASIQAKANPIKPQVASPPAHPKTGEVSPHPLTEPEGSQKWGAAFIAAIKIARDNSEIDQWIQDNNAGLDALKGASEKAYQHVMAAVQARRDELKKKAAA